MSAYFILTQDFTDLERFRQEYVSKVFPFIEKHNGEVIVAPTTRNPLKVIPPRGP